MKASGKITRSPEPGLPTFNRWEEENEVDHSGKREVLKKPKNEPDLWGKDAISWESQQYLRIEYKACWIWWFEPGLLKWQSQKSEVELSMVVVNRKEGGKVVVGYWTSQRLAYISLGRELDWVGKPEGWEPAKKSKGWWDNISPEED